MRKQSTSAFPAPRDDEELARLVQELTQVAGGKQDRKPNPNGGQEVIPSKGFVVKTTDQDGHKVFINICSSEKVPLAGPWANGKVPEDVKKQIEQAATAVGGYAEAESLHFPLSLGETKLEKDNKGEVCSVFDVVYNDEALKQAMHFRPLKVYLINMAMGWVKQKKELELDPKYKLPKMRYKGDNGVTPQTMRMDTKPLVTEMRDIPADPEFPLLTKRRPITVPGPPKASKEGPRVDVSTPVSRLESDKVTRAVSNIAAQAMQNSLPSSSPVQKEGAVQPRPSNAPPTVAARNGSAVQSGQAELAHAVKFVGKPVESISITVDWPAHATAESMADSSAEVAGDHVYIDVPGCKALDVQLPFAVTAEGAVMQHAGDNQQLQLRLKYLPCRQLVEQMLALGCQAACEAMLVMLQLKQSQPHQAEALDLAYDSYLELEA